RHPAGRPRGPRRESHRRRGMAARTSGAECTGASARYDGPSHLRRRHGTALARRREQGGPMIDNVRDDLSRKAGTARTELDALMWLLRTAVVGAVLGALYTELRKAPEDRTWNGKLLGVVPYDFRLPTIERLRQSYWNPRS